MNHRSLMLITLLLSGFASTACSPEAIVKSLELPPVTPAVKATFESAVSTVTAQVLTAALASVDDVTAVTPAPAMSKQSLQRLATGSAQSVTIQETITKEDGGTITVTGTITGSGTDANGSMDLNLKAEWVNLTSSDGSTTQKSSGSETIVGKMTWTGLDTDAGAFGVDLTVKGSFVIGAENFTFNIAMTLEGDNLVYTGTVNGESVTGNVAAESNVAEPAATTKACVMAGESQECFASADPNVAEECTTHNYDFCIEFKTPAWTSTAIAGVCGPAAIKTSCPTAGLVGRCAGLKDGKEYVYHTYSQYDKTKEDCELEGGVWTANN